jgi:Mg2+ and Co2+ transporter CorA
MIVRWIDAEGVRTCDVAELPELLRTEGGFVWVDIPRLDEPAHRILLETFGFHPRAVQDCLERNHVPKTHVYADHVLVVAHGPESGASGHVHYLELDQLIGRNYLVTVHGPVNPAVPFETCLRETDAVAGRLAAGRLRVSTPYGLSYAVVTTLVRTEEHFVAGLAVTVGQLEQQVMAGVDGDPEAFLERLYQARHQLLTVRTMAAQSREVFDRLLRLTTFVPDADRARLEDLVDQYQRVHRITDGQLAFLHGVTEFYRARTDTKMTIAAERLAVIAALTLPITALSSVIGMNVIVNERTRWTELIVLLSVMSVMSIWLMRWARRHGWW